LYWVNKQSIYLPIYLITAYISNSTKELIEEYTRTVTELLAMIGEADANQLTYQQKAEFFRDTRQCFGRTALVLHGGSTFG
jgi:TAG lipase/lysophosphatidylethanolamine acyltransferase